MWFDFYWVCEFDIGLGVENWNVGNFRKLGRAREATQWFAKVPLDHLYLHGFVDFFSVTFGKKPYHIEFTWRLA